MNDILNRLYNQEHPFKIEAAFDNGFNFCFGFECTSEYGQIVYKQALQTYDPQDGFDWFEGILNKLETEGINKGTNNG